MLRKNPWRGALLAVFLVLVGGGALGYIWMANAAMLTPTAIRAWLLDLGVWGPLALVAALAGVLVVPILPASVLQAGSGFAFGPWLGLACTVIADWLGASLGFALARGWGKGLLQRWLSQENWQRVQNLARRMSWHTILLLRLLPGPAYPLVSAAAGLSHLSYLRYISASLAGVIPGLIILVWAGDLAERSPLLALGIVVFFIGSLLLAGRLLRTQDA